MLPLVERFLDIAVVDVDIEDPANAWCSGRLVDSQTPQFSFYAGGHLIDHKAGFGGYSSLRYWLDDPLGFNGGLPVTTEAES
ncbi:hypothetical protein EOD29_31655, partial [Mesorhizobium sp. M1A.T.Ca.IN.004.03.1.1]|uniref:hypothetical protein n=1 Tax=Mesorhizobium sp. M1A.T.Ca.IN.004.03.1.1 TaxID=2496795 RepID=UPI000FD38CEA